MRSFYLLLLFGFAIARPMFTYKEIINNFGLEEIITSYDVPVVQGIFSQLIDYADPQDAEYKTPLCFALYRENKREREKNMFEPNSGPEPEPW